MAVIRHLFSRFEQLYLQLFGLKSQAMDYVQPALYLPFFLLAVQQEVLSLFFSLSP